MAAGFARGVHRPHLRDNTRKKTYREDSASATSLEGKPLANRGPSWAVGGGRSLLGRALAPRTSATLRGIGAGGRPGESERHSKEGADRCLCLPDTKYFHRIRHCPSPLPLGICSSSSHQRPAAISCLASRSSSPFDHGTRKLLQGPSTPHSPSTFLSTCFVSRPDREAGRYPYSPHSPLSRN